MIQNIFSQAVRLENYRILTVAEYPYSDLFDTRHCCLKNSAPVRLSVNHLSMVALAFRDHLRNIRREPHFNFVGSPPPQPSQLRAK